MNRPYFRNYAHAVTYFSLFTTVSLAIIAGLLYYRQEHPQHTAWELSLMYTHPELFDRNNGADPQWQAMEELLDRHIVRRGLDQHQLKAILGPGEIFEFEKEPSFWAYGAGSSSSDVKFYFDQKGIVSKIFWHFDRNDPKKPDRSREY